MEAAQRVLLIDLENMIGPVNPQPELVRGRIAALVRAAGPVHHALACYARTDPQLDLIGSVLAEMGVPSRVVVPGPDAAEKALLAHARYAHDRGCRTFSVASADRSFTALAELGDFEVIAWTNQQVSTRLQAAARQVRRVPRSSPTTGAVPADRGPRRGLPLLRALTTGAGLALGHLLVKGLVDQATGIGRRRGGRWR
ncbi:NYN domain-containing protein [Saccharothrix syringae]|uniref:NYN domain-containing protein n=1 Tax=Saccharothrix syringae TaxID=103733 RepID=A0A5Q0H9X3_SACSY|nr:NYN domain-containing protein [Saccharothrix syringae]QFZ23021.1 NYN domain-containing protein [Saccharothrix syringae]